MGSRVSLSSRVTLGWAAASQRAAGSGTRRGPDARSRRGRWRAAAANARSGRRGPAGWRPARTPRARCRRAAGPPRRFADLTDVEQQYVQGAQPGAAGLPELVGQDREPRCWPGSSRTSVPARKTCYVSGWPGPPGRGEGVRVNVYVARLAVMTLALVVRPLARRLPRPPPPSP